MTKLPLILCACLVLSACDSAVPESAAEATTGDAAQQQADAIAMGVDGLPIAGNYRATMPDGSILLEELRPDGTYTFADEAGNILEEGRYSATIPAQLCFTPAESEAETCYLDEIGEDGVWRTTEIGSGEVSLTERVYTP